ncbi:MAG TPA: hypothetical protein PKM25_03760 [Candidatus Ozemobacteraceae bacterium]|nr:hypothetical protein [Candidatus Ozemobacteraceae bacterium]
MTNRACGRKGSIGWVILRYVALLAILAGGMLIVDPNYFQNGIAEGFLGLEAAKAPTSPFATELTFPAAAGEPFKVDLGAKQQELRDVRIELLDPDGKPLTDLTTNLLRPPDQNARPTWRTIYVPALRNGTYTLRLSQNAPGQVKAYVFQGPFVTRMVFLPIFAALLLFVFDIIRRARTGTRAIQPIESATS